MNQELTDVQAGFRNSGGTRHQIANICWIIEKAREFKKKKTSIYVSLTTLKPLTVWITKICGKLLKKWEYQTILPVSWETCVQVKKQQLEPCMEQLTGSKLRKEYNEAVYCHPCLFNLFTEYIMRNARLDEVQAGIKIARRNINNLILQMIPL